MTNPPKIAVSVSASPDLDGPAVAADVTDVVVPYARFLERRERRHRIAAEIGRQEGERTIDADVVASVAAVRPLPSEPKQR